MPETRWEKALQYYRSRGGVMFLSYCRFWERHGFVQQSLARELVENGVHVTWLDGSGWRPYHPVIATRSDGPSSTERLTVQQLPELPLRRVALVDQWDARSKAAYIQHKMRQAGGNPVIWIQAGLSEAVTRQLPYIDVYSVFDDPYRHPARGDLARRVKVIVCQNNTARNCLLPEHEHKTHVLLPPMDLKDESLGGTADVFLPPGFPKKVMGYIGTLFSDGFDLELFEYFIKQFPDWGFVIMGRTDPDGAQMLSRFKQYKNFHYFPWVPRNQVASVWKQIHLTLLFYLPNPTQDGAFPVKIVESVKFGVPCLATRVPKTADLEGVFPRSSDREELKSLVEKALAIPPSDLQGLHDRFSKDTDPREHLIKVAEWLQN